MKGVLKNFATFTRKHRLKNKNFYRTPRWLFLGHWYDYKFQITFTRRKVQIKFQNIAGILSEKYNNWNKKKRNDKTWKSNIIIYYNKLEVPHSKKKTTVKFRTIALQLSICNKSYDLIPENPLQWEKGTLL